MINFNNIEESFNIKYKRIKEIFFNIFILKKNKYLNINYIFLEKLNLTIYYINLNFNNFNIFNIIDNKKVINLIINNFNLKYNLIVVNFVDLYSYIIINFNYSYYFFINYLLFIIYKKIYFRSIYNIKSN